MESLDIRLYKAFTEEFVMHNILNRVSLDRADFLDNINEINFDWQDNHLIVSLSIKTEDLNEIQEQIIENM